MNSKTSDKQITANKVNSKKGGVKSSDGKNVSSLNAIKHGLLSQRVLPLEQEEFQNLMDMLKNELQPSSVLKNIILERIAFHTLQLNRLSFAKNEYLLACENPGKIVDPVSDLINFNIVEVEPYEPKVKSETVKTLFALYHRYEVSVENRLYKAIREFNN